MHERVQDDCDLSRRQSVIEISEPAENPSQPTCNYHEEHDMEVFSQLAACTNSNPVIKMSRVNSSDPFQRRLHSSRLLQHAAERTSAPHGHYHVRFPVNRKTRDVFFSQD